MTQEKKQELRQLLQEAIENLEIRPYGGFEGLSITPDQYKWHLQRAWSSYSEKSLWIVQHFTVDISGEKKSKFLEFIKAELEAFIHEDKILSASIFVFNRDVRGITRKHSQTDGDDLNSFLQQLLKIAIFRGIEKAASDFEKCTKEMESSFQSIALLTGTTSETEIHVFDGVRLIPLSNSTGDLPRCWGGLPNPNRDSFNKMLLVIDYSIFPVFHNPFLPATTEDKWEDKWDMQKDRFRFEVKDKEFSNFNEADFHEKFCQALSLACNSAVQIDTVWDYIAEDKLFNINRNRGSLSFTHSSSASMKIGNTEIGKAKRLYEELINPNSKVAGKLQIPIDRWIKSKTNKNGVDKMIDLGIAFESIYLPKGNVDQLAFQFRLRASWHLGKNQADRKKLIDKFDAIYTLRSKAVHNGELPSSVKVRKGNEIRKGKSVPTSNFIPKAQDLCRKSIIRILKDREFPDWKDLILG